MPNSERKNLIFTARSLERIDFLKKEAEFASMTEVLRDAVHLYWQLATRAVQARLQGKTLEVVVRHKGESEETLMHVKGL